MEFKKSKIGLTDRKTNQTFKIDGYFMDMDLYGCLIEVAFGQEKQIYRFYERCNGFLHTSNRDTHFLWVKNPKETDKLVHEIYHLVVRISKRVGLSEDEDNEQQAYLMGWLFRKIRELK